MIRVEVKDLKENEILAVPVVKGNNTIFMQSDTVISKENKNRLIDLGIDHVYIKEREVSDIKINSDKMENFEDELEETVSEAKNIVSEILDRHIYKHNDDLKYIGKAAEDILNTVLSNPNIVSNITEIKSISTDMYSHCINVCTISTILALKLKMSTQQVKNVAQGAILHDIGLKYINAPYENISYEEMNSKDKLEYKKHTIYGYSSIEKVDWLSETAKEIILLHHENSNGSGFPFGYKNKNLKQEVRLVSVCDDFDSLISGIGNKKLKIYEALEYIKVNTGTEYDVDIAGKLIDTVAVYPVGINVLTSDKEIGVVVRQNKEVMDRPVIRMLLHEDGSGYEEYTEKDLLKCLTTFIVDTL